MNQFPMHKQRSEAEMIELILETARQDERIRAVIMNGSRANPNAPRDIFQDYDIVYLVTEMNPFVRKVEWIKRFGELMILQLPDDMQDPPPEEGNVSYAYLMQFMDGNRIDLTIFPLAQKKQLGHDSQSILLLDKDGLIGPLPPPSDQDNFPKPPTAKAYFDCCNEFWWVSPYAAKGLWRNELTYAKRIIDVYLRDQLMKMLTWRIGIQTAFQVNPGKEGKYFNNYLPVQTWELLLSTYTDSIEENNWNALFAMAELFRESALMVAMHFGFEYPQVDDDRVSDHLRHVKKLPRDAQYMYEDS